jgi:hypothetical protein
MRLGQLVARPVDTPRRAVTAITLPCRAYAAVLVALGCVLSRDPLGFNPDALGDEELAAHFANLCALRPGTTVTVASGRIKRVGRFTGVDHSRGDFRTRRRSCLRPEASSVSSCSDLLALLERLARPSSSCLAGALLGRGRTPPGRRFAGIGNLEADVARPASPSPIEAGRGSVLGDRKRCGWVSLAGELDGMSLGVVALLGA